MVDSAQGTIEYLVILAIVVVIALVVVALLVNQADSFQGVSSSVSKLGSSSGSISISEAVVGVDGNGLITFTNNSGGFLTITNLSVNGVDSNYSSVSMPQGSKKIFSLSNFGTSGCSCVGFIGKKKTCTVIVYATSLYGLQKQFPVTVSVDCVSNAAATNSSAVVQFVPVLPYIIYPAESKLYIHPTDSSTGAGWGCAGTLIGASSATDGFGNTIAIVAGCAEAGIAARLCSDLNSYGYDDWYLPAKTQLETISAQKDNIIEGDYASQWTDFVEVYNSYYWTSTEVGANPANYAWPVGFDGGIIYNYPKSGSFYVRCVRGG